ncbi:Tip elongation protein 1 [Pleurostoma richardsiae]|uniref:Tip elongation protein 1 n=1 Tax=Pleurostoma richardsiae TaxID=41990 RepID=A0AA38RHW7_9PEZI|nr:Tip elongation protein 1 [Pleurostoma richardsiae]
MSSTITTASASTLTSPPRTRPLRSARASKIGGIATASTPNLNSLYSAHSRLAPPSLSRKASYAALTQNSLASIPDDTESYALDSVLSETAARSSNMVPGPLTPARPQAGAAGDDGLAIGDTVEVPGNIYGTVRFVGSVPGRKGTFAGVELHSEFASRGKNSGEVDGVSYFTTTTPGAGLFIPIAKAIKRESPPTSAASSFPLTPTTGPGAGLKVGNQNSTNYTPPTPSLPKFSQSLGPGRASSPTGKRPRTSLPRPDSPVRKLQMTPSSRPSIATPATKVPPRYGSPTSNKFSQSVRGPGAGDPTKRGLTRPDRKISVPPRSASALGQTSAAFDDEDTTPVGPVRTRTDGAAPSVSSLGLKLRPPSRAAHANDEEIERLRAQLEERDRQLKEQAATLAEMESSLSEVQDLMEHADAPRFRRSSLDDQDSAQLRALVREKNDKIAMLTAEFDAHRADFRSTIDTLEMASTETERVYEKKIDELMQELHDLQERTADVDTVASQLKQLEELVQELEEGLEDARRGEAEARGEVEFLRGEVERTRSELRREREKAAAAINGTDGATNGDRSSTSKELEQKEDEIRGLKAIIHSLSRDSVPGDVDRPLPQRSSSFQAPGSKESLDARIAREKLEREVAELHALLDNKNNREEELEREVEILRRGSATTHRASAMTIGSTAERSSIRDSRGTVILARDHEPRSPEARKTHTRGPTLDTMPESDAFSSATETSTLWCEICETSGHDILTCTNMFGPQGGDQTAPAAVATNGDAPKTGRDVVREGLKPLSPTMGHEDIKPAPLSPMKTKAPTMVPPTVKILPNPMDSGPVAGKESGVVDAGKWCALCERDGHDSVDCPFEDAF